MRGMIKAMVLSRFLLTVICGTIPFNIAERALEVTNVDDMYSTSVDESCKLSIDNTSVKYFHNLLETMDPNIVYFHVAFNGTRPKHTKETFHPKSWVWTYSSTNRMYPYLYWRYDYSIYSFGLLGSKTPRKTPHIYFHASKSCNLTLGTKATTLLIADELKYLIKNDDYSFKKYQTNYWCFLAEVPGIRHSFGYFLRLYFDYPEAFMKYNCCRSFYKFTSERYVSYCPDTQVSQWPQCSELPYILGLLLFLYSPVIIFELAAFLAKNEKIDSFEVGSSEANTDELNSLIINDMDDLPNGTEDSDWVFLDGSVPKNFTDLFRNLFWSKHPITMSRFRRLAFVLLLPFVIYLKLLIYGQNWYKTVNDSVQRGVPSGFLTLLANTTEGRMHSFVPALGGPVTILICFFVFNIIVIVLPKSYKQVVQNALPQTIQEKSPLCFNASQIMHLSELEVKDVPGYKNASNLLQCSFYMLFTSSFWRQVLHIQVSRYRNIFLHSSTFWKRLYTCLLPFYIIVCVIEIVLSIVYYCVPLLGFTAILVRGTAQFFSSKIYTGGPSASSSLKSKLFVALCHALLIVAMAFYLYSVCLVFIESFFFLFEFVIYSYLAVIMYPSVSFGYLFSAVALAYYVFRLIRGFGRRYLELLHDTIETTLNLVNDDNHVSNFNGHLVLTNVKVLSVKSIRINGRLYSLSCDILQDRQNQLEEKRSPITFRNNAYGIRKYLFEYVAKRHAPVHKQVLKILFQLALITLLLALTVTLTAGLKTSPSELSEVMHVVFIITVGALPRVLEVAMSDSSEHIEREIKMRNLEATINHYLRENGMADNSVSV